MAKANTDPNELRQLFDTMMPQFSQLIDNATLAVVAKKPVSYLPTFRYVGPRLHEGSSTVLLGDCAHTVKPYFGLGANSALEDVKLLSEYLSKYNNSIGQAIHEYSKFRTIESKTLVRISRELDRPGRLGFITFILPIILDSIFHKLSPKLFMPNVITMLQRENYTFQQLARRKRLDRLAQISIVSGGLSFVAYAASTLVSITSKYLHVRPVQVWTSFVLMLAVLSRLKSLIKTATVVKS
jgi:kynurenine 3-monooxygenase